MKKCSLVLVAVLSLTAAAAAQEFPSEPHEFLLGKLAAEEGRYEEALERFDRVISKNPDNPVLLYERAMVLIDAGRIDRAETELRTVVQKSPDFYDANRVLGRVLVDRAGADRRKIEEALKYLQAAYKTNPDDLSTGLVVTQILRSLDRTAEAERILAVMVERMPDQRALNFNYAQVLTSLGRATDAKKYLERTLAIDPSYAPAVMQLLELYQSQNDWQKAANIMAPLIAENPMNLELQRQQGYYLLRAGDARGARDRFRTLIAADPKDERALLYLGESLNELEEYAESEKIFRQLIAADGSDPDVHSSLALSLSGQKKWDEARKAFHAILAMRQLPDHLKALSHTQIAYIDVQQGKYADAVEAARPVLTFREKPNTQAINIAVEALRKQEKHADVVTLLEPLRAQFASDPFINARYVEALVRAGQKERATELANEQIKLGSRNVIATSEAYIQAGDHPSAVALIKSAIAAKPDDVDLQFQLGSVYERAGDRKASETTFLRVLEKNPEHAPSLNYLGYMWADNNVNLERAQEMLERAVAQEPTNGAYVDSLGWVYFRLGKLELAEQHLTEATKLTPRDATVHEHLGDVLAKSGQMQRALQSYRTAMDLDPESKDIDKIRSKIAEIERGATTSSRR